jgi:hypothetical protein
VVVAIVVGALVFALASLRPVSAVTGARQVASLDQPTADVPMVLPWARNGDRVPPTASLVCSSSCPPARTAVSRGGVTVLQDVPDVAGSQIGNSACSAAPFTRRVSTSTAAARKN